MSNNLDFSSILTNLSNTALLILVPVIIIVLMQVLNNLEFSSLSKVTLNFSNNHLILVHADAS